VRRHSGKIVIFFMLALLVATVWLCTHWLGAIRRLCNRAETTAMQLERYLESEEPMTGAEPDILRPGAVLSRLRERWGEGMDARAYPSSVLGRPRR